MKIAEKIINKAISNISQGTSQNLDKLESAASYYYGLSDKLKETFDSSNLNKLMSLLEEAREDKYIKDKKEREKIEEEDDDDDDAIIIPIIFFI